MSRREEETGAPILYEGSADDAVSSQRQCVDCGAAAPTTKTSHTLISTKHGWRLERTPDGAGGHHYEWRCPTCWHAHKSAVRPSIPKL